jgi:ABC-2 type transport system ATP-binding protein
MAMPHVLEFENLTKQYSRWFGRQRVVALDQLSLTVEEGEIFGFLGPNGAGKTTAIHLAMGFMRATRGSGQMLGKPFGDPKTRRRVGFLAENVAFYHRPAEQLVRFYGALNGIRGRTLRDSVREVLEAVKLEDVARRNAGRFSRGMLQRVGLAQALVNDPDQPTSALDPLARVKVRELLLRARARGKTVFLSSHLLSEVELVCDRIAMLNQGRLVKLGKTSDLLESGNQAEIVARGIGCDAFAGAAASNGTVRFAVPVSEQKKALERIWTLGGEVISLNPLKRSLEQIFLEVTADSGSSAEKRASQ